MTWPTDQDYRESIQNPKFAFADAELQSGQVETDAMGLPKPRSGNFATVYKVVTTGGVWAVKCFRYDNPEHNRRYPIIATHLGRHPLSYMVSFRYMSEGMRVGPNRYPLVKMKWLDGERLDTYIERNLSSPSVLSDLALAWVKMLTELRDSRIAHGDLQDRNVLVVQGKLRLVDYDGMYVPALDGSHGLEIGAPHYQHPQRTALDFGPYLDNYSAWLIYCSILALAAQPSLWSQLNAGEECLLFRKKDFDAPEQSQAFRLLKSIPDSRVVGVAQRLEDFLWLPPDQVPAISEQEIQTIPTMLTTVVGLPGSSWLDDYTGKGEAQPTDDFPDIDTSGDTWLTDHVEETIALGAFANPVWVDRLIAFACFGVSSTLCWRWSFVVPLVSLSLVSLVWAGGLVAAVGVTLACWGVRYRREPVYASIRAAQLDVSGVSKEHADANRAFGELKEIRLRHRKTFNDDGARLQERQSNLQSDQDKQLKAIDDTLQKALQQAGNRKLTITSEEGSEKRKLAEAIGSDITRISHALAALPNQERQELTRLSSDIGAKVNGLAAQLQQATTRRDAELAAALKEYQDQVVNGHLQRIRLAHATIDGVGPQLKQRLAIAGFVSAGDIGTRRAHVPGIGAKKWAALHAWRRQLEGPVRAREAPRALPSHKSAGIEQRHEPQIRQLQQTLAQEQGRLKAAQQTITTRFADQQRTLEQQKTTADSRLRQQTGIIEIKFHEQRRQIATDEQTARQQSQQASTASRTQLRTASQNLAEKAKHTKNSYQASLKKIEDNIWEAAKQVRALSRRQNQTRRRYSAYMPLRFRKYVSRVVGRS